MENYLISEAIGDIAGSAYEGKSHRRRCRYPCRHRWPYGLCLLQGNARCPRGPSHEDASGLDGGCQ